MKNFLVYLILTTLLFHCEQVNPIPFQDSSLSNAAYLERTAQLQKAYEEEDYLKASYSLARLKAPKQQVYKYMRKAVKMDINCCEKIFSLKYFAEELGFYQTPYRMDTLAFNKVLNICLQKLHPQAYQDYRLARLMNEEKNSQSKIAVDSSKLDLALVNAFQQIHEDDQKYRVVLSDFKIAPQKEAALLRKQSILDSINLYKIDSILAKSGYPTSLEVSRELWTTPFLVFQHQTDMKLRDYYFDLYASYWSEGQQQVFLKRSAQMKLETQ